MALAQSGWFSADTEPDIAKARYEARSAIIGHTSRIDVLNLPKPVPFD